MIKKFLSTLILIILLFNFCNVTYAADSSQNIIVKNKIAFKQLSGNIIDTSKQVTNLNTQTEKLNKAIKNGNTDINESEKKISSAKLQMQELTKQVDISQNLADTRLKAMYINGSSDDYLVLLLTSKNLSDLFTKYEAIKSLIAFDKKVLSDLEGKRKTLGQITVSLNSKNQQLQQLKSSNVASVKELSDKKITLQNLIKKFNEEKDAASLIIKENEENLVAHAISVIDSKSSSSNDMRNAIDTLSNLLPQLNTDSVSIKVKNHIDSGNKKLSAMIAQSTQEMDRGSNVSYKANYTMNATAYTGGSFTAMGLRPVRNFSGLSTIAVDPSVIPLGTKVYVPGYGYAICADTGGSIKGNIIDLYMNSEYESNNWGRRTVILYVIAYPGQW